MRTLLLVRHPPVMLEPGICYGASDIEAATWPLEQIAALQMHIATDVPILSSPLQRCSNFANALARSPSQVRLDDRLREIDFGDWELQRFDDIDRALIDAWALAPWDFVPPAGESAHAMSVRVMAALDDALRRHPGDLVIVAHGGPLRVVIGGLLNLPREQWLAQPCEPASLSRLHLHEDRVEVDVLNLLAPYTR